MIKISKNKLEKKLGKKITENVKSLGIDTASRTGYCTAHADDEFVYFDTGFIDTSGITDTDFKYKQFIPAAQSLVKGKDIVVVEDAFLHMKFVNPKMMAMICRIGMIFYMAAELAGIKNKYFITAFQSRSKFGFKGNLKKAQIHVAFLKLIGLSEKDLDDVDVIDAILLALCGILDTQEQESL